MYATRWKLFENIRMLAQSDMETYSKIEQTKRNINNCNKYGIVY